MMAMISKKGKKKTSRKLRIEQMDELKKKRRIRLGSETQNSPVTPCYAEVALGGKEHLQIRPAPTE